MRSAPSTCTSSRVKFLKDLSQKLGKLELSRFTWLGNPAQLDYTRYLNAVRSPLMIVYSSDHIPVRP